MTKQSGAIAAAALLLAYSLPLPAQKKSRPQPRPQAIAFKGAPQYSQEELLAAAGIKPGTHLTSAEFKAHAKQLNDTGLFKEVRFTSDSKTLLFTLTPAMQLYPLRLENLPLAPGKDLDATLHQRFPLYHGLLPATGSINESICRTFEEMLANKGAKATVKADLTSGLGPHKITAVNFTVVSPAVHVGHIQLAGVSPIMQARASQLAATQSGSNFDTDETAGDLQRLFEDLYHDQDYAAAQVNVVQADPLVVSDQSIDVPYAVTITEGGIYKLGTIDLPAGALVTRAEVGKTVSKSPHGSGRPLDLFMLAVRDAYNAHGYLDCNLALHPSFNEAAHIVNYTVEVDPGPQYHLAAVTFDGAPEAIAARLKLAWKITPGDLFDQSYLSTFAAQAQKKDKSLSKWLQSVVTTYDFKADASTHQVKCTFHFAKLAQGAQ